MKKVLPEKTIERLSVCRRLLNDKINLNQEYIYSYEIAKLLNITPVQVRRDIMLIGYSGSPSKGYKIKELIKRIAKILDTKEVTNVAIIGMGFLGNAISGYFKNKRDKLKIVASFDKDSKKISQCLSDVRCHHIDDFPAVKKKMNIDIAVLTVPEEEALESLNFMIENGVKGVLNFTPKPLKVPDGIYLEEYDIVTSLEKVTYFSKHF
ncbi:MAG: redox-sensing transcriptional repressor Rex [Bacteroidota bacterium]|nr:redox-sensing transcriptional repressor Rex [Bacteroidota bacterium]